MTNFDSDFLKQLNRVRRLDLSDSSIVDELMRPRIAELVKKKVNVTAYTSQVNSFLDHENNLSKQMFGYFNESGELMSIMGLRFWNSMPFATLSYMFTKANLTLFNVNLNGLNLCFHKCIEVSELNQVTTFFSLQNAKSFKLRPKTWRKNETPLTKKYYSITLAKIKAGTLPKFEGFQSLMDYQTWPYDTAVWMTALKTEFQQDIYYTDAGHL